MKLQLVDNWRQAWRWVSVHCMALSLVVQGAWSWFPDDLKAELPEGWARAVAVVLLVLGIIGRLIKQSEKRRADCPVE